MIFLKAEPTKDHEKGQVESKVKISNALCKLSAFDFSAMFIANTIVKIDIVLVFHFEFNVFSCSFHYKTVFTACTEALIFSISI